MSKVANNSKRRQDLQRVPRGFANLVQCWMAGCILYECTFTECTRMYSTEYSMRLVDEYLVYTVQYSTD